MKTGLWNAGGSWTGEEEKQLVEEFKSGAPLLKMCQSHGRSAGGIIARLSYLSLIRRDPICSLYIRMNGTCFVTDKEVTAANNIMNRAPIIENDDEPQPIIQEEPTMPHQIDPQAPLTTVTTVAGGKTVTETYVYGIPAEQVSDDDIYKHISKLEKRIEELNSIKAKPMKLKNKVGVIERSIQDLVALVDSRD